MLNKKFINTFLGLFKNFTKITSELFPFYLFIYYVCHWGGACSVVTYEVWLEDRSAEG